MTDKYVRQPISELRKNYIIRLIGRCILFILYTLLFLFKPEQLKVLEGMNFFKNLSCLHLLWVTWMLDMLYQIIPVKKHLPLGSQKLFRKYFKPVRGEINVKALKQHIQSTTKSAYKVFILWGILLFIIGALYYINILDNGALFMITVLFYVCDLICVVIWCPFRLILKTRCCTTCRIFNWDHLMMFTPMMFIDGFFSRSLLIMAIVVWIVWEMSIFLHPERFWEVSNTSLMCSECSDKLCTHKRKRGFC